MPPFRKLRSSVIQAWWKSWKMPASTFVQSCIGMSRLSPGVCGLFPSLLLVPHRRIRQPRGENGDEDVFRQESGCDADDGMDHPKPTCHAECDGGEDYLLSSKIDALMRQFVLG